MYQNFLLPAFSPSEWLNTNTPSGGLNASLDYFNSQPIGQAPLQQLRSNELPYSQPGPSTYYNNYYAPPSAIPTSLLQSQHSSSSTISPSVDVVDNLVASPSPLPPTITPHDSPKRGSKRRAGSLDSNESFDADHIEHDHEIAEGVERDGMIWGMKVEDYRALSARERKRVRNRISARTFRAKRKGKQRSRLYNQSADGRTPLVIGTRSRSKGQSDKSCQRRGQSVTETGCRTQGEIIKVRAGLSVKVCQGGK